MEIKNDGFTHILLIDDDEVDVMFVQRELKKLNIPVFIHVAKDGVEALHKLKGQENEMPLINPEIIILDLMMPKMNGIEFLEELREHSQFDKIKVLVLTTSNNERDKIATKKLNINGYFIKDRQFEDFIFRCKTLLQPQSSL